jgi:hypothetical protein
MPDESGSRAAWLTRCTGGAQRGQEVVWRKKGRLGSKAVDEQAGRKGVRNSVRNLFDSAAGVPIQIRLAEQSLFALGLSLVWCWMGLRRRIVHRILHRLCEAPPVT